MTWILVIFIVAIIGGIIGFFSSNKDRGKNAASGAIMGGIGCGYVIFQIFLWLLGVFILFAIGSWLFS